MYWFSLIEIPILNDCQKSTDPTPTSPRIRNNIVGIITHDWKWTTKKESLKVRPILIITQPYTKNVIFLLHWSLELARCLFKVSVYGDGRCFCAKTSIPHCGVGTGCSFKYLFIYFSNNCWNAEKIDERHASYRVLKVNKHNWWYRTRRLLWHWKHMNRN